MGDEPVPTALIRQLNPGIRNLNKIYPGQKLLLPIRGIAELPESSALHNENVPPVRTYRIQEDDSISRIILAELNASPEQVLPAYRLLRRLNPDIENLNNLPPGQMLKLPSNSSRPESCGGPLQAAALPEEKPQLDSAASLKPPPTAEGFLGLIRPVISRMKGAITAEGNYYIPLKDTAQVTIDCSLIPVVELDDGSTVLLDFGNRLSENLKRLITQILAELRLSFRGRAARRPHLPAGDHPPFPELYDRLCRQASGLDSEAGDSGVPRLGDRRQKGRGRGALSPGAIPSRRERTALSRRGPGLYGEKRPDRHGDHRRQCRHAPDASLDTGDCST